MLRIDIDRYIELHRELGYKFKLQACYLRHFATFAEETGDEFVRSETALHWASDAPSVEQRRERLAVVRRFALRMKLENRRHEIPPAQVFGRSSRRRRIPHIYSPDEIRRLLEAAMALGPSGTIRGQTYATLFALIASTGLRISEALKLDIEDISSDGLLVRHTKFRKTRLIPLHDTVTEGLDRYLLLRSQISTDDSAVFLSLWQSRLSYSRANQTFLQLTRSIGLRDKPGLSGPCIHDLRHTFAVRSLERCSGDSADVARHVLALSTYLGHAHPSDTYWYLQATPKLLTNIAEAGEILFMEVIS
jgi:integrase